MQNEIAFDTKSATAFIGGLSAPSKMPCFSFSIPAIYCNTGMKLRNVKNSICSKCYALKGRYVFGVVKAAMQRRFDKLTDSNWVNAMTIAIRGNESSGHFRWHDSGDIQSLQHLINIVQIAKNLPDIKKEGKEGIQKTDIAALLGTTQQGVNSDHNWLANEGYAENTAYTPKGPSVPKKSRSGIDDILAGYFKGVTAEYYPAKKD